MSLIVVNTPTYITLISIAETRVTDVYTCINDAGWSLRVSKSKRLCRKTHQQQAKFVISFASGQQTTRARCYHHPRYYHLRNQLLSPPNILTPAETFVITTQYIITARARCYHHPRYYRHQIQLLSPPNFLLQFSQWFFLVLWMWYTAVRII